MSKNRKFDPKVMDEPTGSGSFTVDNDGSTTHEMPSITALLNRKKLSKSTTSAKKAAHTPEPIPDQDPLAKHEPQAYAPEPPSPQESQPLQDGPELAPVILAPAGTELTLGGGPSLTIPVISIPGAPPLPTAALNPAAGAGAEIQKAQRRERKPPEKLVIWDNTNLSSSQDPLAQGLTKLLVKGATSALFLRIGAPEGGSKVPVFWAKSAVSPKHRMEIWTGLKWDPALVSDMWRHFVREGFIELTPPATRTNERSNRNMVRGAFGVAKDEWFTMVRVGPANACRGVIAIVSTNTLRPDLDKLLPLFHSAVSSSAA